MSDQRTVERAPAKLNLALHVRRRRDDGYHELETLFVFAADGDTVTVTIGAPSLSIIGPFAAGLDAGADNLVTRAERAFAREFAVAATHAITLDKHLPIASGIGGGSADAAATLRALARLHRVSPTDARLFAIAASLGADVPACLLGRAAIGRGKGEALEEIEGLGDMPALLVNPGVAVSTAAVFARWDGCDRGAMADGDAPAAALAGRNDLQPPAVQVAPVIEDVLALLGAQPGVRLARMSGSGATCFALFADMAARDRAAEAIAAAEPAWWRLATVIR
ncbi:4-(cytidine 5'-diphospho)-2-C-methyl-D-erythritol kinase [Sphingomonas sp. RHCKR47]|uniref:4-(cytidine 5'-diphospho)-2-C-methyl-D-erythritol kinase n=1 Tax=Sphingomonas citricola TaxID=2862498 RepID=UPI001CA491B9|nr:4-(cytidine 5'-diphospho)-2-C-methyl-D-erythritol kinase [Sphingomonas citricola]MBW6523765.1 4-(cytidine 5'-diphospho)-2-C-methyl-D-erythritol kinase [Sphingomonas citricola]